MLPQNSETSKQKVIKSEDLWLFLRQNIWHYATGWCPELMDVGTAETNRNQEAMPTDVL
jgi:hypothetical protein